MILPLYLFLHLLVHETRFCRSPAFLPSLNDPITDHCVGLVSPNHHLVYVLPRAHYRYGLWSGVEGLSVCMSLSASLSVCFFFCFSRSDDHVSASYAQTYIKIERRYVSASRCPLVDAAEVATSSRESLQVMDRVRCMNALWSRCLNMLILTAEDTYNAWIIYMYIYIIHACIVYCIDLMHKQSK